MWVTVHTVSMPSEAHVIKMQLEAEGLTVFLKDELTVQTDNFLSNAIGGVKIQVDEEDVELASSVLLRLGYVNFESHNKTFLHSIDTMTKRIPVIKRLPLELRLVCFVLGVMLLFVLLILSLKPDFN